MAESVLITGAAGFIGSHVAEAFAARGWRVVGLDNFDSFYDRAIKEHNLAALPARQFELVEGDITDVEAMTGLIARIKPALTVHLAALAGVRPSLAAPARFAHVNISGLANVLEAARLADCGNVLFASSSSVYGNQSKVPFAEDDPCDAPISPYAATKRAGEMLCQTYARMYGMRIYSLRFFTVFGPRQRPDLAIASFMRKLLAGEAISMFGDSSTSRDYTYIDDIVRGVMAAADRLIIQPPGTHRIYNLGGAHPVTLHELIAAISEVTGIQLRIDRFPMQPGDVERTFADLTRGQAELGYQPATDLQSGLKRQWEWLKAQQRLHAAHL